MYKSDILYPNLEAELARAGIDKKEKVKTPFTAVLTARRS